MSRRTSNRNPRETLLDKIEQERDGRRFRSKRLFTHDFPEEKIVVVPFSDMHWGSPQFNYDMFMENLEWVWENPNAYVIGNGDWVESATRNSVGAGVYEQKIHAGQQLEEVVDVFRPLAQEGRILAITNGNHEDRIYKNTGVDITRIMAHMLEVPYFLHGGFFKLRVGDENYHAYFTHGSSGARLPHTKIKRCLDFATFIDAHIYGMGHVHDLQHHTQEVMRIDNRNGQVVKEDKHFLLTGHYLNWEDGYAQMKGYRPSKKGTPKVKLNGNRHDIRVSL